MSLLPYKYRKQLLEDKLKDVLDNPYSDTSNVQAAREAVRQKLRDQEWEERSRQRSLARKYGRRLP